MTIRSIFPATGYCLTGVYLRDELPEPKFVRLKVYLHPADFCGRFISSKMEQGHVRERGRERETRKGCADHERWPVVHVTRHCGYPVTVEIVIMHRMIMHKSHIAWVFLGTKLSKHGIVP